MRHDSKVKEYPDLIKKVGGFVVNTNSSDYKKAQARSRKQKKEKGFEDRLSNLESKLSRILDILEGKN